MGKNKKGDLGKSFGEQVEALQNPNTRTTSASGYASKTEKQANKKSGLGKNKGNNKNRKHHR